MKKWYESKIVIINIIVTLSAILALPELTKFIDVQSLLILQGVLNIILRIWFTDTLVEKKVV